MELFLRGFRLIGPSVLINGDRAIWHGSGRPDLPFATDHYVSVGHFTGN